MQENAGVFNVQHDTESHGGSIQPLRSKANDIQLIRGPDTSVKQRQRGRRQRTIIARFTLKDLEASVCTCTCAFHVNVWGADIYPACRVWERSDQNPSHVCSGAFYSSVMIFRVQEREGKGYVAGSSAQGLLQNIPCLNLLDGSSAFNHLQNVYVNYKSGTFRYNFYLNLPESIHFQKKRLPDLHMLPADFQTQQSNCGKTSRGEKWHKMLVPLLGIM